MITAEQETPMLTGLRAITASLAIIAIIACVSVSARAQDISFSTPEGQTITLSSMRGNVVVLLFSGVQDPQRREGLKALGSLAERYQRKNVKIYWVSVNPASVFPDDQLKRVSSSVSVLRDINQAAFKHFSGKVAQLPTIIVLDQQGAAVGQPRGGITSNSDLITDLSSTIDGLLQP
jgi:peroxiredoxin